MSMGSTAVGVSRIVAGQIEAKIQRIDRGLIARRLNRALPGCRGTSNGHESPAGGRSREKPLTNTAATGLVSDVGC